MGTLSLKFRHGFICHCSHRKQEPKTQVLRGLEGGHIQIKTFQLMDIWFFNEIKNNSMESRDGLQSTF